MVAKPYVPNAGDVIRIDFDPARGHEQASVRPALVMSPRSYNQRVGMMLVCPITSVAKGYSFEVPIQTPKITGVVLSDQIRAFDWNVRPCKFIVKAKLSTLQNVRHRLSVLLDI